MIDILKEIREYKKNRNNYSINERSEIRKSFRLRLSKLGTNFKNLIDEINDSN